PEEILEDRRVEARALGERQLEHPFPPRDALHLQAALLDVGEEQDGPALDQEAGGDDLEETPEGAAGQIFLYGLAPHLPREPLRVRGVDPEELEEEAIPGDRIPGGHADRLGVEELAELLVPIPNALPERLEIPPPGARDDRQERDPPTTVRLTRAQGSEPVVVSPAAGPRRAFASVRPLSWKVGPRRLATRVVNGQATPLPDAQRSDD